MLKDINIYMHIWCQKTSNSACCLWSNNAERSLLSATYLFHVVQVNQDILKLG